MMQRRWLMSLCFLLLAGLALAQSNGVTVATDLNGPMGLLVAPDGALYIVDSGVGGDATIDTLVPETGEVVAVPFGASARVVRVDADGAQADLAALPSMMLGSEASGPSRLAWLDEALYVTSGGWVEGGDASAKPADVAAVVRVDVGTGEVTVVADTWAFEAANNPDGFILESHPYGLAAGADGLLYVADAGANDLVSVDPASGAVALVTVFEGVPGMFPNDFRGGAQENDPVPTGIVVGDDGALYVAFLPGFPPVPGSSKVVRVDPTTGATSEVATGMDILTDLQLGPDGALYAVHLADFGEMGPQPDTGAIYRIVDGAYEAVLTGLSFPTAIAFDADGNAFVTRNGVGAPGTGEVVRFDGLASAMAAR